MNVLLLGYYGHKNIGDDLFVKNLLNFFRQANLSVSVICDEVYYQNDYLNDSQITFYRSSNLSKLDRFRLILNSHYIVWGGGTLNFSDAPKNLLKIQRLASLFRKKFGFLGIGLDSLKPDISKSVYNLFDKANFLYLRDHESYKLANEIFKSPKVCCLGGDLAFLDLSQYTKFSADKKPLALKNISFSGKHWWGGGKAEDCSRLFLEMISKYGTTVHFLPANQGDGTNDNKFHAKVANLLPAENYIVHTWSNPDDFFRVLSEMDFHIGNRLHSIIIADILGIPNIGINMENIPKIKNYIDKTGVLTDLRVIESTQDLNLENLEMVLKNYQNISSFAHEESASSQACLNRIFDLTDRQ